MENFLNILLVDDEEIVHQTIGEFLVESGHGVCHAYNVDSALKSMADRDFDIAIVDIRMPGMDGFSLLQKIQEVRPDISVVIITGHGDINAVRQAVRLGAVDFLTKPVRLLELEAVLEKCIQVYKLRHEKRHLRETIKGIQAAADIQKRNREFVGTSIATRNVREQIRQAVEANCDTILVTGETGTGKEVVAREIHFQAGSDESPFIAVSCPALPDTLVESELFGHTKGAFTGADDDKAGSFELADGGTLFLDEVADLSTAAQAKLLRVLETRAVRRVGGTKEINVNVRVISATNTPLEELVEAREFRPDLYYRLNAYTIHILALRERPDDIIPLAEHFLSTYAEPRGLHFGEFSPDVKSMLLSYRFPGNARELRNIMERAAILCKTGCILPEHLNLPSATSVTALSRSAQSDYDIERANILKALEAAKWNRSQAAIYLGMPYSTLRYKMQKLGIS